MANSSAARASRSSSTTPSRAKTKDPKDYKHRRQAGAARRHPRTRCTGRFAYIHDFRVPGMLHGRVVRPPSVGAKLESVDESSVKNIPGIVKVVREGNFLGVVARTNGPRSRRRRDSRPTWSKWEGLPEQAKLFEHVRAHQGRRRTRSPATSAIPPSAMAQGRRQEDRTPPTTSPSIPHGSIGPSCAVAEFKDGKLTSWSASQATHDLRKQLAEMFALPVENVRCIYLEGSGCYGRNGHEDAAADAALLAKAVGKPVRVQWSRADEHGWEPKGPPTLMDLRASMDAAGNVTAWESEFFIPQQTAGSFMVPLTPATLAGLPQKPTSRPGNIFQNSAIPYKFANVQDGVPPARNHAVPSVLDQARRGGCRTPTPTSASWTSSRRRPASTRSSSASNISTPPTSAASKCSSRLMTLAKWDKRPRRSACERQRREGPRHVLRANTSWCAPMSASWPKSRSNRATGDIRVPKFYITHDCGQIINPDGLANQLEGNIIQTVSRTLFEELKFDRSQVTSLDWESYPILTFPDVPEIVIDLIDRPNERPWGAGEPSAAVVPSAISNAMFDATGVRLRSVPYTPTR